ncbi:Major facilitator superfamily domain general substrate transporter [Penicillium tannophilum]|nr:Major facilitator superfamily domain general substrate transporter [Penicillium tannophilum]
MRSDPLKPAVIFLISTWYRKNEQSKRFIIFLTADILSGAFGSIVSGAITSTLDGAYGIRGWRWLFIVEGCTTAGISLIVHWTLLDYPHRSRGLSLEEQVLAQNRLIHDGMADPTSTPGQNMSMFHSFLKALLSWQIWLLTPAYMTIIGALAISYFYPTLINGMGYNSTASQYMTAPLYLVSLVVAVPVCIYADRKPQHRAKLLVADLIAGLVFFALTAGIQNYTARYVFLCFINMTIWTGNALGLSFATTAFASVKRDTRAIMLAMMNGIAGLAQLYGSALFPDQDAPEYLVGFTVFAVTFAVGAILYGVADVLFRRYPYKD